MNLQLRPIIASTAEPYVSMQRKKFDDNYDVGMEVPSAVAQMFKGEPCSVKWIRPGATVMVNWFDLNGSYYFLGLMHDKENRAVRAVEFGSDDPELVDARQIYAIKGLNETCPKQTIVDVNELFEQQFIDINAKNTFKLPGSKGISWNGANAIRLDNESQPVDITQSTKSSIYRTLKDSGGYSPEASRYADIKISTQFDGEEAALALHLRGLSDTQLLEEYNATRQYIGQYLPSDLNLGDLEANMPLLQALKPFEVEIEKRGLEDEVEEIELEFELDDSDSDVESEGTDSVTSDDNYADSTSDFGSDDSDLPEDFSYTQERL